MKPLLPDRARALLESMADRRVLVLGDVMLDEFIWGQVARISPEAPVPVVQVTRESFHVGGAGNVAANVRALGGQAVLAGVVGEDEAARRVRTRLIEAGVETALVNAGEARPTTLKTRIIAHQQQIVRTDREQTEEISAHVEKALLREVRAALPTCAALVVSDYQKGVVTSRVMKAVVAAAGRQRIPVLVDPKLRHLKLYRGATLVTPNQGEAEEATGIRIRSSADLQAVGAALLRTLGCRAALITRGEHGMSLFRPGKRPVHVPATAREVFDVTGAGDTVIATLGLALAARTPLPSAAVLANHAAGVVVGKLGTATTSPAELLRAVGSATR